MFLGRVEIQSLMQVDADSQSPLVDLEERSEPFAEESHHARIAVREPDRSLGLGAFTRVESNASNKESLLTEPTDPLDASVVALLDLSELALMPGMWATMWAVPALAGGEGDVADPDADAGLGDAELVGDLLQGLVLRAEAAGFPLLALLAAVSHARTVPMGCDIDVVVGTGSMKLRFGLLAGFAAGYYLGAKAGRERYEQLRRIIDRVGPVGKIHAAVDLGRERLRASDEPSPADAVVPPSPN